MIHSQPPGRGTNPIRYRRAAEAEDAWDIIALHRDAVRAILPPVCPPEILDLWAPADIQSARAMWLRRRILRGAETIVVAFDATTMVGFGAVSVRRAQIQAIYVAPALQGLGVGRALLDVVEALAAGAGCGEVRLAASLNAVGFFRRCGYAERGAADRFTSGIPVPCREMTKRLGRRDFQGFGARNPSTSARR